MLSVFQILLKSRYGESLSLTLRYENEHQDHFEVKNFLRDGGTQIEDSNHVRCNLSNSIAKQIFQITVSCHFNLSKNAKSFFKKFRLCRRCSHIEKLEADFVLLNQWKIYDAFRWLVFLLMNSTYLESIYTTMTCKFCIFFRI